MKKSHQVKLSKAYFCVWLISGHESGHESGDGLSDYEMRWMKVPTSDLTSLSCVVKKWARKWGWIIGL
jgi:hypothetical protein